MNVMATVEGEGEEKALPVLLRRLGEWETPEAFIQIPKPIRVRRDRFLNKEDEFRRHLLLAASKSGSDGWILVLLDADDDCPAGLGAQILARAKQCIPHRAVSVVLANREYEAWFIAAARSLNGYRGFDFDGEDVADPEAPRDAKGWIKARMAGGRYDPVIDQPAFSARFDLQQAYDRSCSFRKLCSEWKCRVEHGHV